LTAGALGLLAVAEEALTPLLRGKTRQLSRNFPCEPGNVGRWVAFQNVPARQGAAQAITGVGRLMGVGYYPGFAKDPHAYLGASYKREKGQAGAWVWTFLKVAPIVPVDTAVLGEVSPGAPVAVGGMPWWWVDEGRGDWWSCCVRDLDSATVAKVREAHGKARTLWM